MPINITKPVSFQINLDYGAVFLYGMEIKRFYTNNFKDDSRIHACKVRDSLREINAILNDIQINQTKNAVECYGEFT